MFESNSKIEIYCEDRSIHLSTKVKKGYSFCKRAKIEIVFITWLIQNYICGTQFSICLISYNWEILCLQYQMLKVISIGMDLKMLYGGYIFAFVSTKVLLLLLLLFFFFGFSFHIRTMLWNSIKFSCSGKNGETKQNKNKTKITMGKYILHIIFYPFFKLKWEAIGKIFFQ